MGSKVFIDAYAVIKLYETELGGRNSATPSGEFSCLLVIDNKNIDCRFYFDAEKRIFPGETQEVAIKFLDPERAKALLGENRIFHIWELRQIGEGRIKKWMS